MPKGFWPSVVAVLTLLEGQDAPGEVELQVWWTRHRRICLETPEVLVRSQVLNLIGSMTPAETEPDLFELMDAAWASGRLPDRFGPTKQAEQDSLTSFR